MVVIGNDTDTNVGLRPLGGRETEIRETTIERPKEEGKKRSDVKGEGVS